MNKGLLDKLIGAGLVDDDCTMIIMEKYEGGAVQVVDVETFGLFFGDAHTYDDLVSEKTFLWNGESMTSDAGKLGYKTFFDKWHEMGII